MKKILFTALAGIVLAMPMDANIVHPVGRAARIRVLTTKTGFSTCTRIVTATARK